MLMRNDTTMGWERIGGPESVATTPDQQKVLDAIRKSGEARPKDVHDLTGLAPQYIQNTLAKLIQATKIERTQYGKYRVFNPFGDENV